MYTTREVAERLRVDPKTVLRWIKIGKLKAEQLPGGQYRITEESIIDALSKEL